MQCLRLYLHQVLKMTNTDKKGFQAIVIRQHFSETGGTKSKRQMQWLQHYRRKKKKAGSKNDKSLPLKIIADTVKTKGVHKNKAIINQK